MRCRVSKGRLLSLVPAVVVVLGMSVPHSGYALSPTGHVAVLFELDSAEIMPVPHQSILQVLADWSHGGPNAGLLIECYADRVGSEAYNMALSERRCQTVRDALMKGGVPASKIETRAVGEVEFQVRTQDNVAEQANRVAYLSVTWN